MILSVMLHVHSPMNWIETRLEC